MVSEEDRMRRLAFAKYLIEMGSINADNVLPYSATALLNFHDALEFLFDLILMIMEYTLNQVKNFIL